MFKGTGLTALELDQDPYATLNKKMGGFDEADLRKAYSRAQVKDDETVIISSRSLQWVNTVRIELCESLWTSAETLMSKYVENTDDTSGDGIIKCEWLNIESFEGWYQL